MNIIIIGIDMAKNVFAVHGVNDTGKPVLVKPKVSRANLLLSARLPPGQTPRPLASVAS